MSLFNPDYVEMLDALSAESAEFLLVGAFALARHGLSRSTGDMDIWIRPTPANAERVWRALVKFGAPLHGVVPQSFCDPDAFYQIGVAPTRINFLSAIDGVDFDEAWSSKITWSYEGRTIPVIGRESLIKNKKTVGRLKDLADVQWLENNG